jgi:hypothetical protein
VNLRDRLVLKQVKKTGLPVAGTVAGGYAPEIQDIVDIHFQTIEKGLIWICNENLVVSDF